MYMRVKDVATRLDCSQGKVRRMIELGQLPAVRFGGLVRVPIAALEAAEKAATCQPKRNQDSAESQGAKRGTSITRADVALRAARIAQKRNRS